MNGWILLHKKIWDSPGLQGKNKATLMLVWIWLLTHCDINGVVTCGKYQIAKDIELHPSSVYRALQTIRTTSELQVNYEVNHDHTKITILNWDKYQHKVNHRKKQNCEKVNTNKERKNIKKDILALFENLDLIPLKAKFPDVDVETEHAAAVDWLKSTGKTYKDYEAFFRGWLRRSNKSKKTTFRV